MEIVKLNNGVEMPLAGLGTWDLNGAQCVESVREALAMGYRLIDTAQMYKNEAEVGCAIRESGVPRGEIFSPPKYTGPAAAMRRQRRRSTGP